MVKYYGQHNGHRDFMRIKCGTSTKLAKINIVDDYVIIRTKNKRIKHNLLLDIRILINQNNYKLNESQSEILDGFSIEDLRIIVNILSTTKDEIRKTVFFRYIKLH